MGAVFSSYDSKVWQCSVLGDVNFMFTIFSFESLY